MVILFLITFGNSNTICSNACRGYSSFASRPADERIPLSGHVIMQIMCLITSNFCDSPTSPVPRELVYRVFAAIFENPLRHARETMMVFLNKFKESKNMVSNAEDYGMLGVFLVFEKGEKSLKDLIKTIDIALGDKEGKLSRHKKNLERFLRVLIEEKARLGVQIVRRIHVVRRPLKVSRISDV